MTKLIFSIIFPFLLIGCTTKTEYQEVFIPTKCDIPYPILQNPTNDVIQNQRQLILYTKELEFALNCCIKGECE